jgi:acyl carrier protein
MRDPVMAAPVAPIPDARPIRYSQEPMSVPGSSLETEIIAIVKRVSRRPVEPTAHSDLVLDLGFDSLLVFELIAELEDRFDVSIPLNDIEKVRTIAQVDVHLRDLIAQQAGSR